MKYHVLLVVILGILAYTPSLIVTVNQILHDPVSASISINISVSVFKALYIAPISVSVKLV